MNKILILIGAMYVKYIDLYWQLGSALVNTGLSMSRVSEPRSEGTDKRLAAEPPIVIHPNPGINYETKEI